MACRNSLTHIANLRQEKSANNHFKTMIQKFIQRPVLSTVISIIICIAGLIGLVTLPVSQYPEIAPPMVRVST
ncbi:MAG: efflux RND transporter permease subunit, partial [Rikenellaceae bacterium]|nr:efflux RND transporter permease subunit [Rikenellaceae bacterium]